MSPHFPISIPSTPSLCLSQKANQRQQAAPCDSDWHFTNKHVKTFMETLQNYAAKVYKSSQISHVLHKHLTILSLWKLKEITAFTTFSVYHNRATLCVRTSSSCHLDTSNSPCCLERERMRSSLVGRHLANSNLHSSTFTLVKMGRHTASKLCQYTLHSSMRN